MKIKLIIVLIFCSVIKGKIMLNKTEMNNKEDSLKRQKRFLSYPVNGGTSKIVIGIGIPVELGPRRSLNWGINLQGQYAISPLILDWFDKFKTTRSFKNTMRKKRNSMAESDSTRKMFYLSIESVMLRFNKAGPTCLLRAICDIAHNPLTKENGMFGEITNLIFTPSYDEKLDQKYYDAHEAGKWGADCLELYSECQLGNGILDKILF